MGFFVLCPVVAAASCAPLLLRLRQPEGIIVHNLDVSQDSFAPQSVLA
jgi:hypothetical protein